MRLNNMTYKGTMDGGSYVIYTDEWNKLWKWYPGLYGRLAQDRVLESEASFRKDEESIKIRDNHVLSDGGMSQLFFCHDNAAILQPLMTHYKAC